MTEREEFEASGVTTRLSHCTEPGYGSEYADPHTQFAWKGWQAARRNLPLLKCSETLRAAILRADPWAMGLAKGLASLADDIKAKEKQ
jgi:hypothetical protein